MIKSLYNNKFTPNQIISVIAFLLGVAFTNTILTIGSVDDFVCYWIGLFSILFIIGAPAYYLNWTWGRIITGIAFFLFAGYNIYNVTDCVCDGDHRAYVSIPGAIASFCIIYFMFNNKHYTIFKGLRFKSLSAFSLFVIINFIFWFWLLTEFTVTTIQDQFQSWILIITAIWFLILTFICFVLFFYRKRYVRLIFSLLIHLNLAFFILISIVGNSFSDLWISSLIFMINFIVILCLHNKYLINATTNKTNFPDSPIA